jgi:biopolymer transport protein ExbB
MELNFWETVRSSPSFIIIFICSLVSTVFIVERFLFFRHTKFDADGFMTSLYQALRESGLRQAVELCKSYRAPVAVVVRSGLQNAKLGEKGLAELMEATALKEKLKLEKYLNILGTMGNIAPFIGLLGTVVGIIRAFNDLSVSGSGGPSVVAAGIAEALITTAAGLVVAIPSVVAYNYFQRRIGTLMGEIEAAMKMVHVYLLLPKPVEPAEERQFRAHSARRNGNAAVHGNADSMAQPEFGY